MISLIMLASHLMGDFVAQTDWMAKHKFQWDWTGHLVRSAHVAIYTLMFVPLAHRLEPGAAGAFLGLIYITHWLVDTRRWFVNHPWEPKPIMVDQALHIASLALIGAWFFPIH